MLAHTILHLSWLICVLIYLESRRNADNTTAVPSNKQCTKPYNDFPLENNGQKSLKLKMENSFNLKHLLLILAFRRVRHRSSNFCPSIRLSAIHIKECFSAAVIAASVKPCIVLTLNPFSTHIDPVPLTYILCNSDFVVI